MDALIAVLVALLTALLGIVGLLLGSQLKQLRADVGELRKEVAGLSTGYALMLQMIEDHERHNERDFEDLRERLNTAIYERPKKTAAR